MSPTPVILIIDDDETIHKALRLCLERAGYGYMSSYCGAEGIDTARRRVPDLVVCDVNMGEMTGYEVVRTFRADPTLSLVPFVFLTAEAGESERRLGMHLGADDFLSKPVNSDDFLSTVRARLERQRVLSVERQRENNDLRRNILRALPHEFRTPLNAVLGFSDILCNREMRRELPEEEVEDMLHHINAAGHRLHEQVERFLLFSRLKSGDYDGQPTENTVLLNEVEEVCAKVAQRYSRVGDLKLDVENALVALESELVGSIIHEVVDNAFKFSCAGEAVNVLGHKGDADFTLVVSNFSDSFQPHQAAQADAFMQFDRETREQQGTGLGLALMNAFAEATDSYFNLSIDPSGVVRVCLSLPLAGESVCQDSWSMKKEA